MKRFVTTTLAGALIAGFAWAAAPAADAAPVALTNSEGNMR
mgnify:CR=1 FL=1